MSINKKNMWVAGPTCVVYEDKNKEIDSMSFYRTFDAWVIFGFKTVSFEVKIHLIV